MKRAVGVVLWLLLALLSYADDGTPYTPPATVMNLNCASPAAQIRTVTANELYTQSGLYLEMVEIYFNETTTISGWRLYVNDHNTHKYIDIGSGLGDVRYPDGSTGTDTAATYPKGTIIVYQIDDLDPSDGEVFIANTTAPLSEGAAVVVDYFNYYKNKQYNYYAVASSACSIIMSGVDPNLQDLSRLTDGSGDFYQTYPGTDEEVTPSPGGPNTDLLPPDSSLSAAVSIEALFDRTEAYSGDTVTLTLRIVNPSSGSIGVSDVNVSNLIPSGLSYVSHDGGTLLDPLMPSSPYGTVVSTSPQFFWRLVNGTFLLALPTGSSAEINLQFQVTAPAGTTITDTATLSVKQNNTGTASASDTLNVIAYVPPFGGRFDAWDTFRGIADRNISTKIAGKSFTLTVASLDATRTVAQDFNGTVCAAIVDSAGTPITDWAQLLFASTPTQNAVFYRRAGGRRERLRGGEAALETRRLPPLPPEQRRQHDARKRLFFGPSRIVCAERTPGDRRKRFQPYLCRQRLCGCPGRRIQRERRGRFRRQLRRAQSCLHQRDTEPFTRFGMVFFRRGPDVDDPLRRSGGTRRQHLRPLLSLYRPFHPDRL